MFKFHPNVCFRIRRYRLVNIHFTGNLRRHVECPSQEADCGSLQVILNQAFDSLSGLRAYIVDEHGSLRRHINIFVDGEKVIDRVHLTDIVPDKAEVYVMQALSGG